MTLTLHFDVTIDNCEEKYADQLGKDLAVFLEESFFNGEDVLEVCYKGHKLNKK